jgi:hypothetical protein
MAKLVPDKTYTHLDVQNARTKGQLIGWLQGGAVVFAGLFVLKLVGWLPTLLVLGLAGFLAFKVFFGRKK